MNQIRIEPDPYEPYRLSQGMRVGDLLFVSGQTGIDEAGELVAGGSSLAHVVKVTIFLTDMATNFPKIVELRGKWFTPPYPADTIVEVRSLYRPEVEIEIEAIAVAAQ